MCICTYIDDREAENYNKSLEDSEIKELLEKANAIDPSWVIEERKFQTNKKWFRKSKEVKLYTLYHHVHSIEYQIINFAGGVNSIHTMVEKPTIINFLNGYLGGYYHAKYELAK